MAILLVFKKTECVLIDPLIDDGLVGRDEAARGGHVGWGWAHVGLAAVLDSANGLDTSVE